MEHFVKINTKEELKDFGNYEEANLLPIYVRINGDNVKLMGFTMYRDIPNIWTHDPRFIPYDEYKLIKDLGIYELLH